MERSRVLLVDAAPGALLGRELERLLGHGLAVTLNLRRVADRAGARADWADWGGRGGRVDFTDFDPFDEAALLAETVRDGLGHHAVKSRGGVPLRAAFLAGATRPGLAHPLRVIGRAGAGTDHVELAAAARHGVTVTHTPGSNAAAVAEFALAQLLALTRGLRSYDEAAHRGEWLAATAPPKELSELTLGIVGPGRIGLALAGRASALGMEVQAFSRRPAITSAPSAPDLAPASASGPDPTPASAPGPAPRPNGSLPDLLATSDVVSLHLPLTPETRGLIGRAELTLMRPGAILLSTARGGIVDEQALADALRDPAHPLAAAAVDTFEHEHAAFASPLFGLPNALLTPHVAGMTRTAMATAALRCADHIAALLAGRPEGIPVVTA
ncbi:NAD(P)-dependent oxidoreductase [Streptomyces microflavus]|uniref:NAD(P)-dependent oxidoreductase n=1 Tax=Streptomyces microflavus TaxID=1919 RepID=UPI00380ED1C6